MQEIKSNNGIPIQMYLEQLEEGAMEQAKRCALLPHAFHHLALMPDAHQGFAMPVGGVMALRNAIMPNAVGVDIGCGMIAARTTLRKEDVKSELKNLAEATMETIPLGFNHHQRAQSGEIIDRVSEKGKKKFQLKQKLPVVIEHFDSIPYQLGTLGGGNHFIEYQVDQENLLWVMLHSGSRNIGLKIAKHYHQIAKSYGFERKYGLPSDYAYLPKEVPEFELYINEMKWAMDFALQNRQHMLNQVFKIMQQVLKKELQKTFAVQTHHNYASLETHFSERVWVHRKGAVRAAEGEYVTIPGSMGTASYIGMGKGYDQTFQSCSHGAGRLKGRNQAKREISLSDFQKQIGDVVIATPKLNRVIDEAPAVYKDIEDVMDKQVEMVERVFQLKPLAVVKG